MKTSTLRNITLFTLGLSVSISCQEDQLAEDQVDQDMDLAVSMADEYLNSKKGRSGNSEKSITVLKWKDGVLLYDTNTDEINGYRVVKETTITAYAEPGEFIFWYSGGGVSDLEEIDFDEMSEQYLRDMPEEINADHMWVTQVPEDIDEDVEYLKYDVVYRYKEKGMESEIIRLDPKIRVTPQ